MDLNKEIWTKDDIDNFQKYLESFKLNDEEKINWYKKIINTSLPILGLNAKKVGNIVNQIHDGNYLSFLDFMCWQYYENVSINGLLICKIKDFDVMKKYLDIYSEYVDNWANCDLLTFNIKGNEERYMNLVLKYIRSSRPFKRRIGVKILFEFLDDERYLDDIFMILEQLSDEEQYYVNMIIAWLLSECFVRYRNRTIEIFKNNNLKKFVINKAISKCRDSRRVKLEDKELLLQYKK